MIFKIDRSTDPTWETAPWIILRGDEVLLDGIQEQSEAQSICDLLNQPPLKVVPINARPRWLAGGRGGRHREVTP
jgi:hypothetical protein